MFFGLVPRAAFLVLMTLSFAFSQSPTEVHAGPFDEFEEDQLPQFPPTRPPVRPDRPPQRPPHRPPQRPPQRPPIQRPTVKPQRPQLKPNQPPPAPPPLTSIPDDWDTLVIPEPGGEDDPNNVHESRLEFERQNRSDLPMFVSRLSWSQADEEQFGKFVAQMGRAISARKCNSVRNCFASPEANMYAKKDAQGVFFTSDCADFPYLLRAYFAYHNGLPFSHVVQVRMNQQPFASANDVDINAKKYDLRDSPYGNSIVKRGFSSAGKAKGSEPNLIRYLTNMFNSVSTGTFRISPLSSGYSYSDLYPVKLDKQGIRPGTVVHDTGHAMIVWDVDPRGLIRVIDANTQAGVGFKTIQPSNLQRSRPDQALGFFKFRPMTLVGATQASNGAYYGGKVVVTGDQELFQNGHFSLEQWFGPGSNITPGATVDPNAWKGAFKKPNFYEYLTQQLRDPNVIIKADESVAEMVDALCDQFLARLDDVKKTLAKGVHTQARPAALPADIFGQEDPTWGELSSPGRDSRLRAMAADIVKTAVSQYKTAKAGGSQIRFDGSAENFVTAIRAKLAAVNKTCVVRYQNSAGKTIALSFNQLLSRLNRISFDPYHCAEKRWGASGNELATCRDSDNGNEWYEAEANMRNVVGKTSAGGATLIRSNAPITLSMLRDPSLIDQPDTAPINLGTAQAPVMNLDATFASPRFLEMLAQ